MVNWLLELNPVADSQLSFAQLFSYNAYKSFRPWFDEYIVHGHIPIVLVANDMALSRTIPWATEVVGFPGNAIETYHANRVTWRNAVQRLARNYNNTLFAFSLGPVAKIFIHEMWIANNKNTYVDFGSAIDLWVKGFNERDYADPTHPAYKKDFRL